MATKPKKKPQKKKNVFSVLGAAGRLRKRKREQDKLFKQLGVEVIGED